MTINLESEIVGTSYNPATRVCTYTIQKGDKRWTGEVPLQHLEAHKGPSHKTLRRQHVAKVLQNAMAAIPDAEETK